MFAGRFSFACALAALGLQSSAVSAVTFSASFEKTLTSGLATLAQDLQANPKLQAAVTGVPLDVAGWAALSQGDILTKLSALSTQKADAIQYLVMDDPTDIAKIDKFMDDSSALIIAFAEAIESGEYATAIDPVPLAAGGASSTPAPVAQVGGSPSTAASPTTPGSAPAGAPSAGAGVSKTGAGPVSSPANGKSASIPASSAGAASTPGSAGKSASAGVAGAVQGVSSKTVSAATGGTVADKANDASTPSKVAASSSNSTTNSTGLSAASLSLTDGNSSTDANGAGATGAADPKSVAAQTQTGGSTHVALSAIAAAVVISVSALVV